ncbi:hypothetical protein AB0C38_18135 [Amycolatopsis sp. NPDC048633]|uniref:hypothetical protein n=1 Tax=Amycolatopsis sp. NPDC048633 TaxID=3157095 RepID=UPI0033EB17D3
MTLTLVQLGRRRGLRLDTLGWTVDDALSLTTVEAGVGTYRRAATGWYRLTRDRLRRSGIVLASSQGRSAGEIAAMFAATEEYVREARRHTGERFGLDPAASQTTAPDHL